LHEKIEYGRLRCINNGTVHIITKGEALQFIWRHAGWPESGAKGLLRPGK